MDNTAGIRLVAVLVAQVSALLWFIFANIGIASGVDTDLLLTMFDIIICWSLVAVCFPRSRLAEPMSEIARLVDFIIDSLSERD